MTVTVHRGTHQIGGCAVEIRTENSRILIDAGSELDGDTPLEIEGITKGKSDCDAVLFTHYHVDHTGMLGSIHKDIPLYIGDLSLAIMKLQNERQHLFDTDDLDKMKTYKTASPMVFGDIKVTPFAVDHSAFDSHLFLIEADGKKVLHTGDFRSHGFRGKGLLPTLEKYVGKVDAVICEGTTLSREDKAVMTEYKLSVKAKKLLRDNRYVFIACASSNIDRIAAFCSVVPRGKYCLCDGYQKRILDTVREQCGQYSPLYQFGKTLTYSRYLDKRMEKQGFCMFVRPGNYLSAKLMKEYRDKNPLVIYSMWSGYLENNDDMKKALEGYRLIKLHTSGHADPGTIKSVIEAVNPDVIIPIHTTVPEKFPYGNAVPVPICDGQEITI